MGATPPATSALFGVVGILAALRHRDSTGKGQYLDIVMLDCELGLSTAELAELRGSGVIA